MISDYPLYDEQLVFDKEKDMVEDYVQFIKEFRTVKAENNITKDMKVMFETPVDPLIIKVLRIEDNIIDKPLDIKSYKVLSKNIKATIYYEKEESEDDKLLKEKEIADLKASIERREKLLSNENYVNKAPANIVELDKKKLEEEKARLAELCK